MTYNDIMEMRILPMFAVEFTVNGQSYVFENLESDSTWTMDPIEQPSYGMKRTVAYELSWTAIVPYNDFEKMTDGAVAGQPTLIDIDAGAGSPTAMVLRLKALDDQENGAEMTLNALPGGATVAEGHLSWSAAKGDMRPRLTLSYKGVVSLDGLDSQASAGVYTNI